MTKTIIDVSRMEEFMTCRYKYFLKYIMGYQLGEEKSATSFGSAIHSTLDDWFVKKNLNSAVEVFRTNYSHDETEKLRTIDKGIQMLTQYDNQYKDLNFELISIEKGFKVEIADIPGFIFVGRIDKIINWDGIIYVMDHKTTSQMGQNYFNKFSNSLQLGLYIYVVRKILGLNCSAGIIDALQVAKTVNGMERKCFEYSEDKIKRVMLNIGKICSDIKSENYYHNYFACGNYGKCDYLDYCSSDLAWKDVMLKEDFVVKHWDPLDGLTDENIIMGMA